MGVLIGIINIFVIPVVSVCIYTVRMNKPRKLSFDTIMLYAFFAPMLMLCTRAIVWILYRLVRMNAKMDNVKYTAIALFAACLLPFVCEMIKKAINIRLTIEKAEQESGQEWKQGKECQQDKPKVPGYGQRQVQNENF